MVPSTLYSLVYSHLKHYSEKDTKNSDYMHTVFGGFIVLYLVIYSFVLPYLYSPKILGFVFVSLGISLCELAMKKCIIVGRIFLWFLSLGRQLAILVFATQVWCMFRKASVLEITTRDFNPYLKLV